MVYVLGVSSGEYDGAAACLVADGKLLYAAEEERFCRLKHRGGPPLDAVRYCLSEAGIGMEAVGHAALTGAVCAVSDFPCGELFRGTTHRIESARAQLYSAFHVSPFDEAVVASVDGLGTHSGSVWGVGDRSGIAMDGEIRFPHSLGIFYRAITQWLGFPEYGDEYKVMGLAAYGQPAVLDEMRRIVRLEEGGGYRLALEYFDDCPDKARTLYSPALADLLGPARSIGEPITRRHMDVARSAQAMYEDALFHLLNSLHARYGGDKLALAGGCALNSVANGKICRRTPFRKTYVPPAANAAGSAIGAAFAAWHSLGGRRGFVLDHAYWGPQFGSAELEEVLQGAAMPLQAQSCSVSRLLRQDELCSRAARAIADGKVVGWFQGRMEFGPRALGNRSILGDPRRADMKDILNLKIKRRESFRPFAPSVLREAAAQWFDADDDVPFMCKVYPVRGEKRSVIPAVTHVDGSGRVQTVHRATNPRYYALIEAFERITGVPIVLNTSFNENEPVVCRPQEALDCFLRTGMDVLVLGDWFIERGGGAAP